MHCQQKQWSVDSFIISSMIEEILQSPIDNTGKPFCTNLPITVFRSVKQQIYKIIYRKILLNVAVSVETLNYHLTKNFLNV